MGFKKGEGATNCINYIVNSVYGNKRRNKTRAIGFIDFSQALDNVNILKLWEKMHIKNIESDMNVWKRNSLINRKLIIEADDFYVEKTTNRGLRQGCVLSPTAFLIYTAKFHQISNGDIMVIQYAKRQ
jgi:hypothetical protein